MNLPISKPVVKNVFLEDLNPDKLLLDLAEKKFTGFIYLVTYSNRSFEENFILFLKGNIRGAIYISNIYNVEIYGKKALNLCFNSLGFSDGLLNIYELTTEQLKLVVIFNDKIKYDFSVNKSSISKIKFKYDVSLLDEVLKKYVPEKTDKKYDLFNKFNMNDLLRY